MIDPKRRRQILQLISSRHDLEFQPETFTGKVVRRQAQPGVGPSAWQTCQRCEGSRTVRDRFSKTVSCPDCNGAGGKQADAYTGDQVEAAAPESVYGTPYGMSFGEHFARLLERDTKTTDCPDCQDLTNTPTGLLHGERCRRCDGTGRAPIAGSWLSTPREPGTSDGDANSALLNAIDRRDNAGSYRELDRAFTALSGRQVTLLDEYAAQGVQAPYGLHERVDIERALNVVDRLMPDLVRVPSAIGANEKLHRERGSKTLANGNGAGDKLMAQRDREIRKHDRDGKARQWIAREYGLSVAHVKRVVNGETEAA